METMKNKLARLGVTILAAFLLAGCSSGLSGQSAANENMTRTPAPAPQANQVEQDPALRITTAELQQLFSEVYGNGPLISTTLEKNDRFLLADARPLGRYQEGHIPGAIHLPPGEVAANLANLPRDREIIFYCGGLHCPLSTQAARVAREHGLTNVRIYYEGDPGWTAGGNYLVATAPYVNYMMTQSDEQKLLLFDARPSQAYRKAFIPGAVSLPWAQWGEMKHKLPRDLDARIVFYCGGGTCALSHQAARAAKELGYKKVAVYSGGHSEWQEAGLPLWGNEPSGVLVAQADLPTAPGGLPRAINADQFRQLMTEARSEIAIIDVRDTEEFAAGHIPGAINIPDFQFHANYEELIKLVPTDKQVIIHCVTGIRAEGVYHAIATRGNYDNEKGVQFLNNTINIASNGNFTIQ